MVVEAVGMVMVPVETVVRVEAPPHRPQRRARLVQERQVKVTMVVRERPMLEITVLEVEVVLVVLVVVVCKVVLQVMVVPVYQVV
jgi:hypothetical protein